MPKQSPSQTVGPFFSIALTPEHYGFPPIVGYQLVNETTPGEHIEIEGRMLDGEGQPVPDAVIDLWQADHNGKYSTNPTGGTDFTGFGRCATDTQGRFRFVTVKPGRIDASQAPHVILAIFARGLTNHVFTRVYFAADPANDTDPVLVRIDAARRETLIATPGESSPAIYQIDIRLQGDDETVFFDA
jgi:protocatechuate 3,4-dioxygenase alpha subunit